MKWSAERWCPMTGVGVFPRANLRSAVTAARVHRVPVFLVDHDIAAPPQEKLQGV